MIQKIHLCFKHSGMVDGKKNIIFHPGINVIAGPNGSGKSTLLKAIYQCPDCVRTNSGKTNYYYFNSEEMNPHRNDKPFRGLEGSIIRVRAMFSSHGETMRDVLKSIPLKDDGCWLLDEPEEGHDLKWIIRIRKGLDQLKKKGIQMIIASHHPIFWKNAHQIELKKDYIKKSLLLFQKTLSTDDYNRKEN